MGLAGAYLTKVPREYFVTYADEDEPLIRSTEEFCDEPSVTSYTPNLALDDTYDNWIIRYGIDCGSKMKIGMIGASYTIGWAITIWFLPRLSDVYGR